jgi:hypothetical protein
MPLSPRVVMTRLPGAHPVTTRPLRPRESHRPRAARYRSVIAIDSSPISICTARRVRGAAGGPRREPCRNVYIVYPVGSVRATISPSRPAVRCQPGRPGIATRRWPTRRRPALVCGRRRRDGSARPARCSGVPEIPCGSTQAVQFVGGRGDHDRELPGLLGGEWLAVISQDV